MCRHPYEARWRHNNAHCPNLVPNEHDRGRTPGEGTMALRVKFSTKHMGDGPWPGPENRTWVDYDSLVQLWKDWYNKWRAAPFPRLMVRFEVSVVLVRAASKYNQGNTVVDPSNAGFDPPIMATGPALPRRGDGSGRVRVRGGDAAAAVQVRRGQRQGQRGAARRVRRLFSEPGHVREPDAAERGDADGTMGSGARAETPGTRRGGRRSGTRR